MNRNLKIGLFVAGVLTAGYLVYRFAFKKDKPKESGGNDTTSPIVYDKASREIIIK